MPIREHEITGDPTVSCEVSDPVNNLLGNWEFSEILSFDDKAGDETEKIVCDLNITCWTKTNGRGTSRLHAIMGDLMILVNLTVGAKDSLTMVGLIELVTKDKFPWTPTL